MMWNCEETPNFGGRLLGHKYFNPPITQVVCEFRFQQEREWDMTFPGLIYARLNDTYKSTRRISALETGAVGIGQLPHLQFEIIERTQFYNEDDIVSVQVSPNYLSVTHTSPYRTWESFLPAIQQALKAYFDVVQPTTFNRIGLRYTNTISFASSSVDLEDYFDFYPFIGENLPQTHVSFMCGGHFPHQRGRDMLRIQIMSGNTSVPENATVALDLDYFLGRAMPAIYEGAIKWLHDAHDECEHAFEGCIKSPLRAVFDEEASR